MDEAYDQEPFPLTVVLPMMKGDSLRYYPLWRREGESGYRFYRSYKNVHVSYDYENEAEAFNQARREQNEFNRWLA